MTIEIRAEHLSEYHQVEELVREAFWNVYQPGCSEHLILHQLRDHPNYLKDLSKLITVDGKIAGQITYSQAQLRQEETGALKDIALFGTFAVAPAYQKQGLGEQLLETTLADAEAAGISHLVIMGNPAYYQKFGFASANDQGIYLEGQDKDEKLDSLLVLDLQEEGRISKQTGPWIFGDPEGYEVDEQVLEKFDQTFPPKKKEKLPGQLF